MRTLHAKPVASDVDSERAIRCVTCNSVCGVLFQCGGRVFFYQRHNGREILIEDIPKLLRCECGTVWDNVTYHDMVVIDRLPKNIQTDVRSRIYNQGRDTLIRAEQGKVAQLS